MIRVATAAILAVTLFAIAQPAIEDGRETAAERAVERELVAVERAITNLDDEAVVPYRQPGARQIVVLYLPERSFGSLGVEYVALGALLGGDDSSNLLAYKVADRPPNIVRIDVDLRVECSRGDISWLADDPLVLRTDGRHRLAFEPVRYDGQRVVVVRKL